VKAEIKCAKRPRRNAPCPCSWKFCCHWRWFEFTPLGMACI